jgi:ubiquinone/menaquinone biosynthesis C-methylase UbiE
MAANYNNSAWFYDALSRLVYGKALVNAQVWLLHFVPKNTNVLIVGGGTGWILEELTRLQPSGLNITYVEVSANMIALSEKRITGNNQVFFINNAIENVVLPSDFDVIITPFLFDNFTEQTLDRVFNHIHKLLKPKGLWLNCDFQLTGKWWQNVLLKSMFVFFRVICSIEASKLPQIEKHFTESGVTVIDQKLFFGAFVRSAVYTKK